MKSRFFIFLFLRFCGVAVGLTREYIFIDSLGSWSYAKSYCKAYYKDLATITTVEEENRLLQVRHLANPRYYYPYGSWIGLSTSSDWKWEWSDGEPFSFHNWLGTPYVDYLYSCVIIPYDTEDYWKTFYCNDWANFLCYRALILVKENKTWEEALDYCRTNYTGLASVTSDLSLHQLKLETVQTQTESVWTGLRFVNGIWFWVSGEQLGSLATMPSCPAPSYRCGSLNTTSNTLQNQDCNERLNFICYWT